MRKYTLATFYILVNSLSYGQKAKPYRVDNSTPEGVVKAIFYAADNNDFSVLKGLCDPLNRGNDDSKMICWLCDTNATNDSMVFDFISESGSQYDNVPLETARKDMIEFLTNWSPQFVKMFKGGKISGTTKHNIGIEGIPDIPSAYVPIQYSDLKGNLTNGSVRLIKTDGKWYIIGFRTK